VTKVVRIEGNIDVSPGGKPAESQSVFLTRPEQGVHWLRRLIWQFAAADLSSRKTWL